jgi:hypothetical protein
MWLAHQPLWVSYLVVAFWLLLILLFLGLLGWAIYIGIGGLTPAPSKVNPYTNTTSPGHEPPPTGMGAASPASHTARLIITLGGREQTTLVMPLNQLMPWPGQSVTTPASATPPPAAPASATATGTNAIPSFQGVSIVQPVELEVVVEGAHLATGVAEVGDGKATGAIRLFNPGSSGVTLPAGTWLATIKGQRYVLAERVYVPPTDIANQKLGTANTTVVAEKAGPDGNLASGLGRFNLGNGLQLQGLGPITGGTTRQIKTPSKSDLAELLTSLQSQSDARVRATLAALEAPKEGPGPDDNQALAGSRLPPNYQFLTGYDHTVLNSVFTPQVREGEEVTGPDGQVQGKLVLKVRALMYSPQALKKLANRIIATSPGATTTGADPSLSPTPEWELVTVKLVPPASTPAPAPLANGNPTGTGEINGQLAVTLERPVNYALLRAALTSQYQSWTGRAAQVGRLADDLRKLGGVESVQLVWPPDLNLNLNLTTPGAVSDAGAGGGTGAGAGASVGNNQDPLFKIALEFVEPSGPAQPQAAPTPTPATHLEGGNG